MGILEIIGIIFLILFGIILLLIVLLWLFLPLYFKYFYSKEYDGSYERKLDNIKEDSREALQKQPKLIYNEESKGYSIKLNDKESFSINHILISYNNQNYSSVDSQDTVQLKLSKIKNYELNTNLGNSSVYESNWIIPLTDIKIITRIFEIKEMKSYIFELELPNGLENCTKVEKLPINNIFPIITNYSSLRRVLAFKDTVFCPPQRDFSRTYGPILFFNDKKYTAILSSLEKFMINSWFKSNSNDEDLNFEEKIYFGSNSEIKDYPKGYTNRSILIFDNGIKNTFSNWGEILLKYHGLKKKGRDLDIPTRLLGYFTDNGAHHYYNPMKGMKYDETFLKIKKYSKAHKIPYHFYHLDSWWYEKTSSQRKQKWLGWLGSILGGALYGGALKWEPDPNCFDMSLAELSEKIDAPFTAHNRWFEQNTPYKDKFKFIDEGGWSMPNDPNFWDYIMKYCKDNHIILYEQDWMSNQIKRFSHFKNDINAAELWLKNMAESAEKYGISVQYCMETPAMVMFSIFLPAVTHCRTSDDYHGYAFHNYDIPGFTQASLLANSLGLRPFKDTFKTSKRSRYRGERKPELECLVASLSTGPVAPGDEIGYENRELIMRSCRDDGLLLKPDQPLLAADLCFIKNDTYYVCSASSTRNNHTWYYVLTINLFPKRIISKSYRLEDIDICGKYVEYDWHEKNIKIVNSNSIIKQNLKPEEYKYRIYSPLFENGISVIGNTNKFATLNDTQFKEIITTKDSVELTIYGIMDEIIEILVFSKRNIVVNESDNVKIEPIYFEENMILSKIRVNSLDNGEITIKIENHNKN